MKFASTLATCPRWSAHVARAASAVAPVPFLNRMTFSKSAILHRFPNFYTLRVGIFRNFFSFKSMTPWKVSWKSVRTLFRNPEHRRTDAATLYIYRCRSSAHCNAGVCVCVGRLFPASVRRFVPQPSWHVYSYVRTSLRAERRHFHWPLRQPASWLWRGRVVRPAPTSTPRLYRHRYRHRRRRATVSGPVFRGSDASNVDTAESTSWASWRPFSVLRLVAYWSIKTVWWRS